MRSLVLLAAGLFIADAFRYPGDFVQQVLNYPNVVTQASACLPIRGTATGAKTLLCDPKKILNIEQGLFISRAINPSLTQRR